MSFQTRHSSWALKNGCSKCYFYLNTNDLHLKLFRFPYITHLQSSIFSELAIQDRSHILF